MTNKKEVAQAIWDAYLDGYSKALMTPVEQFDTSITSDSRKIVADVLREVVNLSNEWIEIGGDSWDVRNVVYVTDILDVADELEAL